MSADLNIRERQLAALEENRFDLLPAPAFTIGFIRSYATALGLNAEPLIAAYKAEQPAEALDAPLSFPKPVARRRLPGRFMLASSLAATFGLYMLFGTETGAGQLASAVTADPAAPVAPFAPADSIETAFAAPARADAPAAQARPEPEPAPAATQTAATGNLIKAALVEPATSAPAADPQVRVKAHFDAWLTIRDREDAPVFTGVIRAGEERDFPMQAGLTLTTSNAGALSVQIGDAMVERLGANGAIVEDMPLDRNGLVETAELSLP